MAAAGLPVRLVPESRRERSGRRPRSASAQTASLPRSSRTPPTARVLMLAYMDAEALDATLATGEVHFHSRSRDRLWRKGETSGNVLRLVDLALDCDGDALLVTADPAGPTCHRGTRSCFDPRTATPAERCDPGLRLARDAVVDDRRPRRRATGGLVHDEPARWRRRRGRPQGHRGGHRGAARGQGRRRRLDARDRARPSPARPPTCSTTRSCCSPSATCPRRPSSRRSASRHAQ